jgi:hypothetical protein
MLNWEQVELGWFNTWRAEVPGGWLVWVRTDSGTGLTFYPDPQHQWKL